MNDEQYEVSPLDRSPADWLSVEEAILVCADRGLNRTPKTIRKWASRSFGLDSSQAEILVRKQDTINGNFRWMVERISLERKVEQELELLRSTSDIIPAEPVTTSLNQGEPAPTDTDKNNVENIDTNIAESVRTSTDATDPVRPIDAEMVEFLKQQLQIKDEQIAVKDSQIESMLERDHETNILIQGLQGSLTGVVNALPGAKRADDENRSTVVPVRSIRDRGNDPVEDTQIDRHHYGV